MIKNIAIIGASGSIGHAFVRQFADLYKEATVHAFSRSISHFTAQNIQSHLIDYGSEFSIEEASTLATKNFMLDRVIVATGFLHDENIMPEKSLKDLSSEKFHRLFQVNTVLPALIAKHFLPKLNRENKAVFAVLSARVGSITDNRLGGWYAYRASKVALNMILKNAAIEIGRRYKKSIIIGLHPGTVNSPLSKPFQTNVPDDQMFTADFSVKKMIEVLDSVTPEKSGSCFAWDGKEIEA